ncbi:hypothetical protein FHT78_002733 [Rhizobium sp. BK196]|nr:hypothetical protein [Rhizobium sp. BK196]
MWLFWSLVDNIVVVRLKTIFKQGVDYDPAEVPDRRHL